MSELELNSLARFLEADEPQFRAFANALPNFVWLARGDGSMLFFNDPLVEFAGLDLARVSEHGLSTAVHSADADSVKRWTDALRSGHAFDAEFRLRRADGTYRLFLFRASAVRRRNGEVAYWLGTAADIDAEKRAVENLDFAVKASAMLTSATGVREVCERFAGLAVERFADWCMVLLSDPMQRFKLASLQHRQAERVRQVEHLVQRYPAGESDTLAQLLSASGPTLFPEITEDILRRSARDEEHFAAMREMQFYSAIIAPMRHDGELLGGIVMYSAESRRRFTQNDVDVLMRLTEHAGARIHHMQTLRAEQRERRRLQFLGRAAQAVYESFDLTSAFGNLVRLIVSEVADMAAVFRLEDGQAARVVAAAHQDPDVDDAVRSFVGIRVMHGEAEKRFAQSLQARKPLIGRNFAPGALVKTVWPYLSTEISAFGLKSMITIPLHSRGNVYGAMVAYYREGGREFNAEDVALLVEVGHHASVAMENADVFERERRMSETLQDSLLPPSLPQVKGFAFDAVYLPSASEAQVGGDWYDAFELEDRTIVVTAGDVTGRGAHAAVVMGKLRHLLAIAPCYERDPARILDTVESVLARRYPDTIVTAFLGFIDPEHHTMHFANAGHLRRFCGAAAA